jgi:hypothetical protein
METPVITQLFPLLQPQLAEDLVQQHQQAVVVVQVVALDSLRLQVEREQSVRVITAAVVLEVVTFLSTAALVAVQVLLEQQMELAVLD